jgi:hypothetical protein
MADTPAPVRVAYFYKTRWGAHAEFVELFTRNHWPIMHKQLAAGRFSSTSPSRSLASTATAARTGTCW